MRSRSSACSPSPRLGELVSVLGAWGSAAHGGAQGDARRQGNPNASLRTELLSQEALCPTAGLAPVCVSLQGLRNTCLMLSLSVPQLSWVVTYPIWLIYSTVRRLFGTPRPAITLKDPEVKYALRLIDKEVRTCMCSAEQDLSWMLWNADRCLHLGQCCSREQ